MTCYVRNTLEPETGLFIARWEIVKMLTRLLGLIDGVRSLPFKSPPKYLHLGCTSQHDFWLIRFSPLIYTYCTKGIYSTLYATSPFQITFTFPTMRG